MLQATGCACAAWPGRAPLVVANEEHRFLVAEQLRQVGATPAARSSEPVGRNTAPAIAVAALQAHGRRRRSGAAGAAGRPRDRDEAGFRAAVHAALPAAAGRRAGHLRHRARPRRRPATATSRPAPRRGPCARCERFVEKPDAATAQAYLADGGYYWNSGMFAVPRRALPDELAAHRARTSSPRRARRCDRRQARPRLPAPGRGGVRRLPVRFDRLCGHGADRRARSCCRSTWLERRRLLVGAVAVVEQDGDGNAHRGDVLARDCRNTLAIGDKRLIALIGLEDMVVVETDDAVLVAHKDRVQDVKEMVAALSATAPRRHLAPQGVPALGQLRRHRQRRALPGQAHHGQAGRGAAPADAPPPRRALGRGHGHRARDLRRQGVPAVAKTRAPTSRSAASTGWRIPGKRRCT